MTRDAEMRTPTGSDLVLANIGQETDAWGVTRIPASTALAVNCYSDAGAPRRAQGRRGSRACAACCSTPRPAATTS